MWGSDLFHTLFRFDSSIQSGLLSVIFRLPPCFEFRLPPCEFKTSSIHVPVIWGSAFFHVRFSLNPCEIQTLFIWGSYFLCMNENQTSSTWGPWSALPTEVHNSSILDSYFLYMRFRLPPYAVQTSSMCLLWGPAFFHVRFSLDPCEIRTPFIWGSGFLHMRFRRPPGEVLSYLHRPVALP